MGQKFIIVEAKYIEVLHTTHLLYMFDMFP